MKDFNKKKFWQHIVEGKTNKENDAKVNDKKQQPKKNNKEKNISEK